MPPLSPSLPLPPPSFLCVESANPDVAFAALGFGHRAPPLVWAKSMRLGVGPGLTPFLVVLRECVVGEYGYDPTLGSTLRNDRRRDRPAVRRSNSTTLEGERISHGRLEESPKATPSKLAAATADPNSPRTGGWQGGGVAGTEGNGQTNEGGFRSLFDAKHGTM